MLFTPAAEDLTVGELTRRFLEEQRERRQSGTIELFKQFERILGSFARHYGAQPAGFL